MTLKPRLRRVVLTAHVICAVGWLGAIAAFLALAIVGLTSQDGETIQSVYISLNLITRYVISPLSFIPLLLTGPLLSLATPWGLFRHYWVVVKLVINILCTFILIQHTQMISRLADAAAKTTALSPNLHSLQVEMVIASAAALMALLVATALAVIKPRGLTPYGQRKQEQRAIRQSTDAATQVS